MQIKFIKFCPDVKMPVRKHPSDTGADFFLLNGVVLQPHETRVIPLGFGVEIPNGYTGKLQVRTSIAKQGIHIEQCAIDAGYNGELHAIVTNTSGQTRSFVKGERIGYLEVYPCVYPVLVEDMGTPRGDGWCGSTNKKEDNL